MGNYALKLRVKEGIMRNGEWRWWEFLFTAKIAGVDGGESENVKGRGVKVRERENSEMNGKIFFSAVYGVVVRGYVESGGNSPLQ